MLTQPHLSTNELDQIYQLLESKSTQKIIAGLNKLRQNELEYRTTSYLLGMSWFHPDKAIRRRVKYILFRGITEDYAHFLKGKWRFSPAPSLPKLWEVLENVVKHPQIDAQILRNWAYTPYLKNPQLQLNKLGLHYLSSELGTFKHLEGLDLSYNNLLTLPPEFGKLKKLEMLSLAHNQIAILPAEIKKLKKLRILDMSANQGMNNLPRELANLNKLSLINLSHNSFKFLPLSVCALAKLNELNIAHNQVNELPTEIKGLEKLKKLIWSANNLTEVPVASLLLLPGLSVLDISDNPIESLPKKLTKLPRLKKLIVKNIPALDQQQEKLQKDFAPVQLIF